jgi:hypothetical protein
MRSSRSSGVEPTVRRTDVGRAPVARTAFSRPPETTSARAGSTSHSMASTLFGRPKATSDIPESCRLPAHKHPPCRSSQKNIRVDKQPKKRI